ncbi:PEP/pyruvate-binding domain-containing protein [Methyloprofundus sp.]|uniref:PEP/pyruvate-binding domain-containing protein n=1 Tax=Methyloprofundus sp. TaxID=2020875 RepID=UPI003D0FBC84
MIISFHLPYMKNVQAIPEVAALIDQWVHYVVNENGVHIEPATEEEALKWLVDKIPAEATIPESDLSFTTPIPLTTVKHEDWIRVGVKAANVAELGKILADGIAPRGYALPFAMYDAFMRSSRCVGDMQVLCNDSDSVSFYDYVEQLLGSAEFNASLAVREQKLVELREMIESADVVQSLVDEIEAVRLFWEPAGEPFSQKLRVRSSTNNEDLQGFNGAGLYSSFTHKPKEGKLINSIKQVWGSLWTLRAFEERRLHRIDHLKTYMGVLIHPNYGDEQVNGVAISKNIYNPGWEGFYVNAQYGELSITNPEPIETASGLINPIPDEFLITRLAASVSGFAWETQFIRHSNIEEVYDAPVTTENVLTQSEIDQLRENLQIIHAHFKKLYQGADDFAMDIEFKITETDDGSRGNLAIKQARPWVD